MQPEIILILKKKSHCLSCRDLQCHPLLTAVVDHYFMAAFSQFGQKISINIKHFKKTRGTPANLPRYTSVPRYTVWEALL